MTRNEWICKWCENTECHYSIDINAELKHIRPMDCPLALPGEAKWIRCDKEVGDFVGLNELTFWETIRDCKDYNHFKKRILELRNRGGEI